MESCRYLLLLIFLYTTVSLVPDQDKQFNIPDPAFLEERSDNDWTYRTGRFQLLATSGSADVKRRGLSCTEDLLGYLSCCKTDEDCDVPWLFCNQSFCDCNRERFFFRRDDNTGCEERPSTMRELDDSCTPDQNCYVAYATCKSGKCVCKDGFFQHNGLCYPKTYNCPRGRPLLVKGYVKICGQDDFSKCPNNSYCLEIPLDDGTYRYDYSAYGGYCCLSTPDLQSKQKTVSKVCVFGTPANTPPDRCPEEYYVSNTTDNGLVCCPKPCVSRALIRDGKCFYDW